MTSETSDDAWWERSPESINLCWVVDLESEKKTSRRIWYFIRQINDKTLKLKIIIRIIGYTKFRYFYQKKISK